MSRQSVLEAARALVQWHREIPAQVVVSDVETLKGCGPRVAALMEQGRAAVVDLELVEALCRAVDDYEVARTPVPAPVTREVMNEVFAKLLVSLGEQYPNGRPAAVEQWVQSLAAQIHQLFPR